MMRSNILSKSLKLANCHMLKGVKAEKLGYILRTETVSIILASRRNFIN